LGEKRPNKNEEWDKIMEGEVEKHRGKREGGTDRWGNLLHSIKGDTAFQVVLQQHP